MKSRIIKLFRKAAFLGYYVFSRLFIPIIYNYAYRYGELTYLSREDFHGQDLNKVPGLTEAVAAYVADIRENGMRNAMEKIG